MTPRQPPHNLEAEAAVLGAMLLARDAIGISAEVVSAEDFYKPAHATIFAAIVELEARGDPVDPVTLSDHLASQGLLNQVGGNPALVELQTNTPAVTSAGRYAQIVADDAALRRLIAVSHEISELGYAAGAEAAGAVDKAEALVFGLTAQRAGRQLAQFDQTMEDWFARMDSRSSGELSGVRTGWHDLDDLLLGLHPGQLVTLAGRPAMGKSAMAAAMAFNVAQDKPVLFVSLEMSLAELQDRFVSSAAKVDLQDIRRGQMAQSDWTRINEATAAFEGLPLYVVDDAVASLLTIRGLARRVATRHGAELGLVVVDYLQLVQATGRSENRQVEVAEISRGLKRMALEMGVPVLALAQLNRGVEMRADKRPMLSDLRESGAVENDSDVCAFCYRDEYYDVDTPNKGIMEVIVAKQRNGPTGIVRLFYDARYGRLANIARGSAA